MLNIDNAIKAVVDDKTLTRWEVEEAILELILNEVGMAIPDKSAKEYDQLKQVVEIANGMGFDTGSKFGREFEQDYPSSKYQTANPAAGVE